MEHHDTIDAGTRPLATGRPEPAFFSNATNPDVQHCVLNNVAGHIINLNNTLTASDRMHRRPNDPYTLTGDHPSFYAPVLAQVDSDVYVRCLLPKGRGFPLWLPQPHDNLPSDYRKIGVSIGDVGIVTVNGNCVPDNFIPLEPPQRRDITKVPVPSMHQTSGPIEVRSRDGGLTQQRLASGFSFLCSTSEGAILTIPDGASAEDLQGVMRFREYALQHAESWYLYAREVRGREAGNGSIYFVTGSDKSKSWGIASFSNVPGSFTLTFTPRPIEGTHRDYSFSWEESSLAATNSGPRPIEYFDEARDRPQNQCTFIRGFKVSLSRGLWARLWGRTAGVSTITDVKADNMMSSGSFFPFGWGQSWLGGIFPNSSGQGYRVNKPSEEELSSDPGPDVIVASDFQTQFRSYHPSNVINEHLLKQVPDARIAITHDTDWFAVIREGETSIPDASELLDRVCEMYNALLKDGAVSLVPNGTASAANDISLERTPLLKQDSPNANNKPSEGVNAMPSEAKAEIPENLHLSTSLDSTGEAARRELTDEGIVLSNIDMRPPRSMTDAMDFPSPCSVSPATEQWGEELEEFDTTRADKSTKKADGLSKSLSPENNNNSPSSSTSHRSYNSSSSDTERLPRERDDYPRRPENAFVLFRRKYLEDRQAEQKAAATDVPTSEIIGKEWKDLPAEDRQYWEDLAKEKKKEHEVLYPNYVYRPQRTRGVRKGDVG